jgi:heparin/heparan-sulfate lyase
MRLPDGGMLRDGDGVCNARTGAIPRPFCSLRLQRRPGRKGRVSEAGRVAGDDLLFLLLNDPAVTAEPRLEGLPLTIDFGPELGG